MKTEAIRDCIRNTRQGSIIDAPFRDEMATEAEAELATLIDGCAWEDAAKEKIAALELRVAELGEEDNVRSCLLEIQHNRMKGAEKAWQVAHNKPHTWPDLGELIEWIQQQIEALRAALEFCSAHLTNDPLAAHERIRAALSATPDSGKVPVDEDAAMKQQIAEANAVLSAKPIDEIAPLKQLNTRPNEARVRKETIEECITIISQNTPMEGCYGCETNLYEKLRAFIHDSGKDRKIAPCPVCRRGDVWQEAVCRTEYVYRGESIPDGQEVIDYLLAEVASMLEPGKHTAMTPDSDKVLVDVEKLREIESIPMHEESGGVWTDTCPVCNGEEQPGAWRVKHADDCWLGNILKTTSKGGENA